MKVGTYIRTPDILEKMRISHRGKIPWNKEKFGIYSIETRRKISDSTKLAMTPEVCKKISDAKSEKPLSESHKKAIGLSLKGKYTGENNWNWKGGLSTWLWQDGLYKSIEYGNWRISVFKRDNFTCRECNVKGKRLHAHHIAPKSLYPELMFSLDNGITLCEECHRKTETYGVNKKYMITRIIQKDE